MNDDKVAIDGDGKRRERGHVDADAEREGHQVTEELAQLPVLLEERHGRERHGQQTHENVRQGQIHYEQVGHRLHRLLHAHTT